MNLLRNTLAFFLAVLVGLSASRALGEEDSSDREKPVKAHIKIFNASYRSGVERWETGLDLDFKDQVLAADIRVGEGGAVRTIEFKSKDTVDVKRHAGYLKVKGQPPRNAAASLSASFPMGSVTLLIVHGHIGPNGERLQIDAIREFPVPEEVQKPGFARFVIWNFRPGKPVFLAIGNSPPFELPYRENREFYLNPQETEIFLIDKNEDQVDFRRQLAVFNFLANKNYTGIVSPGAVEPERPRLRNSDSNEAWETITAPPEAQPTEE
jgi:hypothetical protein